MQTQSRVVKIPGPDHPIDIAPTQSRVVVKAGGRVIADTRDALTLREAAYPAVQYIPRKDIDMSVFESTTHQTYCPYKGEASYYSVAAAGEQGANAAWSYETPYEAVAEIEEHLAFYPDRVDSIEVIEG
jgi:uncharacterized protein (DUF427 family)